MISPEDLKSEGRHLRRARYGEGSVIRVGKRVKKWQGYWYEYVQVGTREIRKKRKKIVGPGTMSKQEARGELRKHLASRRPGMVAARPDCTIEDLWTRYMGYKASAWGKQMAETMRGTFNSSVLPEIGNMRASDMTIDPLQAILVKMAKDNRSRSALQKVRTHVKAMFEYALDINLIQRNPARGKRLVIPKKGVKKPSERFYGIEEVRALLKKSSPRDHFVLRLSLVCGLRPGELFALRVGDIGVGQILVDEAMKVRETGDDLIGEPKTDGSVAYVAITKSLEAEARKWIAGLGDRSASAWLFPSRSREKSLTPMRPANYLKRILKPFAAREDIGIGDFTFQALRRTCATYFRKDLQSAQAQLRHSSPITTKKHYMKNIPAEQRAAVEMIDAEFSGKKRPANEYQVSTQSKQKRAVNG